MRGAPLIRCPKHPRLGFQHACLLCDAEREIDAVKARLAEIEKQLAEKCYGCRFYSEQAPKEQ